MRFYPDQESIDQSELADGLQGRRVQSEALVARSGGAWTLPEIRIPWWNTDTDSLEFAVLPAREVKVAATQIADLTTIDAAAGKNTTVIGEAPRWLWVLGGAGWLAALILGVLLWRSRRPSGSQETRTSAASDNAASQRQIMVEIRRATERGDLSALRLAVLQWGTLHHGRTLSSFNDLAHLSTPSLRAKLNALDHSLYGGGAVAIAELGLIDALREEPVPVGHADQADKLSLYPAS